MPQQIKVTPGSVPWAAVYFNLGNWIVTSQPAYNQPLATQNPYAAIAAAGIHSVVSVRDPSEVILPVNPFDSTEAQHKVVETIARRYRKAGSFSTKYWTPDVHKAAFALPRFIADTIAKAKTGR